jgi:hypothetical protein
MINLIKTENPGQVEADLHPRDKLVAWSCALSKTEPVNDERNENSAKTVNITVNS